MAKTLKPRISTRRQRWRRQEQCAFCHLCEPGERKRRKKERRMARREAQDATRDGETAQRRKGHMGTQKGVKFTMKHVRCNLDVCPELMSRN